MSLYLLHAMLWGGDIERRWSLRAGQGDVVLAGQVHLSDHLWFQLSIAQAAVAQTLPLPSLSGISILTDSKPVRRSPYNHKHQLFSFISRRDIKFTYLAKERQSERTLQYIGVGRQTCKALIRQHLPRCKKGALDSVSNGHRRGNKSRHVLHMSRYTGKDTHLHTPNIYAQCSHALLGTSWVLRRQIKSNILSFPNLNWHQQTANPIKHTIRMLFKFYLCPTLHTGTFR